MFVTWLSGCLDRWTDVWMDLCQDGFMATAGKESLQSHLAKYSNKLGNRNNFKNPRNFYRNTRWLDSQKLNVATAEALRVENRPMSSRSTKTARWMDIRVLESWDCIKNTLRDNLIGSWSKTDSLCQIIENTVNTDWQSDWFSPLLPSKMVVWCSEPDFVSRIFAHIPILHMPEKADMASTFKYTHWNTRG